MKGFLASVFAVAFGLSLTTAVFAQTAGQKVDRGIDKTKDAAYDTKDAAKNSGETIKDKTKDAAETVKDKTKDAAETVKDKTKSTVEKVKDKTRDMKDRVTGHKSEGTEDHHRTSMKNGAREGEIMSLQQALKDKGHDPGAIDGRMGPHTRTALKSYQKAEGLKATGRLDTDTRAKLGITTSSTRSMSPSASPRTSRLGAPTASDTRGDANVTPTNPPAAATEQGVTSTKKQQP
jgi:peptidoglycan hydrolase-like protein with peptidoglycan-binding domain